MLENYCRVSSQYFRLKMNHIPYSIYEKLLSIRVINKKEKERDLFYQFHLSERVNPLLFLIK